MRDRDNKGATSYERQRWTKRLVKSITIEKCMDKQTNGRQTKENKTNFI